MLAYTVGKVQVLLYLEWGNAPSDLEGVNNVFQQHYIIILLMLVVVILRILVKPTQHIPNQDVLIIAANMTMYHVHGCGTSI